MSLTPTRIDYERHCLIYCGDQFCNCSRGPRGRRLPDLEDKCPLPDSPLPDLEAPMTTAPRAPYPIDNFHHQWDFSENLPEDGSPRDLYVLMYSPVTGLHQVSPDARSLVQAVIIDDGFGRLAGGHTVVQHKLRVRRRWLPIRCLEAGYVALLGCERHPDVQIYGHSRQAAPDQVLVNTHARRPRDWEATHFDRTSLKKYSMRLEIAPHGAERRVPRLPTPRAPRRPED